MAKPHIDESQWPIIIIEFPAHMTAEDFTAHFDDLRDLGERTSGPIVAVVEPSGIQMSAVLRMRAGNGVRDVAERFGSRISGVAYVTDSMVTRGAITAIHWIARPKFPTTSFANREDALTWCHARTTTSVRI